MIVVLAPVPIPVHNRPAPACLDSPVYERSTPVSQGHGFLFGSSLNFCETFLQLLRLLMYLSFIPHSHI